MVFAGDAASAERAIAGLEKKFDSLDQKIKRLNESKVKGDNLGGATKGLDVLSTGIDTITAKFGVAGLAATAIGAGIKGSLDEIQRFNSKLDETNEKVREMKAKLQTQDNLSEADLQQQMPAIRLAAFKTPVMEIDQAIDAQRQLSSVGIDEEDVRSGKALDNLLQLRALSNSFGDTAEAPEVTAKALSQFLTSVGSQKGADDIKRVGSKLAMLSVDSPIEASNLKQLSQVGSVLTQHGLDEDEQLAGFRVAFEAQGDAVGSTGFRNVVSRLGTAGTDKTRTEALEKLKLKPEDVAIAEGGVTVSAALDKVRGGLKKLSPVEQNTALKDLFSEESMATAGLLTSDKGFERFQAGLDAAKNAGGEAEARISRFQNSREAIIRRSQLGEAITYETKADEGATWKEHDQLEQQRRTNVMAAAKGPGGRLFAGYENWVDSTADWAHKKMGFTPDQMYGMKDGQFLKNALEQQNAEIRKQTQLLEQLVNKPPERKPILLNSRIEGR
jgi:hypothetical protein